MPRLWVQLWHSACSSRAWAMVACTAKWGSSKIHSVVGTGDLLVLAGRRGEGKGKQGKRFRVWIKR